MARKQRWSHLPIIFGSRRNGLTAALGCKWGARLRWISIVDNRGRLTTLVVESHCP
jgi:hypothetical protein